MRKFHTSKKHKKRKGVIFKKNRDRLDEIISFNQEPFICKTCGSKILFRKIDGVKKTINLGNYKIHECSPFFNIKNNYKITGSTYEFRAMFKRLGCKWSSINHRWETGLLEKGSYRYKEIKSLAKFARCSFLPIKK